MRDVEPATLAPVLRRTPLHLLALLALAPAVALAQEEEQQPEVVLESEGAEQPLAVDGGTYEPDQRGGHDQPEREVERQETTMLVDAGSVRGDSLDDFGFELALSLGGSLTSLDVTGDGNLVRASQRGSFGSSFGLAAGVRFGPVVLGPRAALTIDPSFLLADFGLGVDVILMGGELAPYVRAAAFGSIVAGLSTPLPQQEHAGIAGFGAELGAGVRWRPWRGLIVGLDVAGAWRHLYRDSIACTSSCTEESFDLGRAGESDALQLRISLSVGWAF